MEIKAVFVREMFHDVVVMLLESRVRTRASASNFTPGAVTLT